MNIDDNDFPVCLALVEEGHYPENFDLFYLPDVAYLLADLADVEGIVVTLRLGLCVHYGGVFPGLSKENEVKFIWLVMDAAYLGKCTVVPNVPVMREAVPDESEPALLDVLLDGI